MLSLADAAACLTVSLPVRICASMLRRIFPFSTSTQCFAAGTNQLRAAARSLTLDPSRVVALGMLPDPLPPRRPGDEPAVVIDEAHREVPVGACDVPG